MPQISRKIHSKIWVFQPKKDPSHLQKICCQKSSYLFEEDNSQQPQNFLHSSNEDQCLQTSFHPRSQEAKNLQPKFPLPATKILRDEEIKDLIINFASQNHIDWFTLPTRTPHFGGLWDKECFLMNKEYVLMNKEYVRQLRTDESANLSTPSTCLLVIKERKKQVGLKEKLI